MNSYQALVITDGGNTYTVFTYNCDLMQWSGYWRHAIVGYNARGSLFENHPASGIEVISTAVACPNKIHYQVPWSNLVYKISPPPDFRSSKIIKCRELYQEDLKKWGEEEDMIEISQKLEPCPCSVQQAWRDWGRFHAERSRGLCFLQRIPLLVERDGLEGKFTQQCCYTPQG